MSHYQLWRYLPLTPYAAGPLTGIKTKAGAAMRRYAVAVLTFLLAIAIWIPATHGQSLALSEIIRRP